MNQIKFAVLLLSSSLLMVVVQSSTSSLLGVNTYSLSRSERKELEKLEAARYIELRKQGVDEVSNTEEAAALRNYRLRSKKRTGLWRKKETSLASVLFPGVTPQNYQKSEDIVMYANLVESRKTQVPFEFYDLPICQQPTLKVERGFSNLAARFQGHGSNTPAPFSLKVLQDKACTPICVVSLSPRKLRWMRKLVKRMYRVHLTLDQLPVLMKSKELNSAMRGYPMGFIAPPALTGLKNDEFYLYNHLKFTVTYREDPSSFEGVRISGFDVEPVSIHHDIQTEDITSSTKVSTCNGEEAPDVVNNPSTYLPLRTALAGNQLKVLYSYEVQWVLADLPWADRWDVYVLGCPDDDIHYFAVINSLMVVLFLTGAIAIIIIRTIHKDIAAFNNMHTAIEESQKESGWKAVRSDVFRPPSTSPMMLSVAVGNGVQLGCTFFLGIACSFQKLIVPMNKGQILMTMLGLYILSGSVAGYVSARLYKFCDAKGWKMNTIYTAIALPGCLASVLAVLDMFLLLAGAATSFFVVTLVPLFVLWCCASAPFVLVGSYFGYRADKIQVPVKTDLIARVVPENLPWHINPLITVILGGVLPFGSVVSEMAYIMPALWLQKVYHVVGFLLAVLLILTATCAQIAILMTYLLLSSEDHRWWWKSFWNCASAGGYLLLYSIWFLFERLQLVGVLPIIVYLMYMMMISLCFGLFCGSVGVLASFWFNRTIYGAVKVD
jgi:transmembrane 9 superfamily protein 2/4